jgi:hypothetical protein
MTKGREDFLVQQGRHDGGERPNGYFLPSYSAGVHLVAYIFSNIPSVSFRNRAMETAFRCSSNAASSR